MPKKMSSKQVLIFTIAVILIITTIGCKQTNVREPQSPETMFEKAMEKFENEDWLEAKQLFDVIKLQYSASRFADLAQFHIAEIHFKKKEYILAAYNYNMLRRSYPTSQYYKLSLFKAAYCYYLLSPTFDRDQEYTMKAIETFQDYQRLYAGDSLSEESGKHINELRNKLAEREFTTAKLYIKLQSPRSALVYLDALIADYPDTKFYEQAYFEKISIHLQINQKENAKNAIEKYKKLFPNGQFINLVTALEQKLEKL